MRRRSTVALAASIAAILLVTACGAGGRTLGTAPTPGPAPGPSPGAGALGVLVILGFNQENDAWSGQPAGGVRVILQPAGEGAQTRMTDANGRASFSTGPAGAYDISAVPPPALAAAAATIRDLDVATTGRDIVLILPHRVPTGNVPERPIRHPFTGRITGTLLRADGMPQSGDNSGTHEPGEVGIVTYTGLFTDITNRRGAFRIERAGMSNDRPAVTGSLFGGNWDGVGGAGAGVLGATHLFFTQYAFDPAVTLTGHALHFGAFQMQEATGSVPTTLDADGTSFLSAFDAGGRRGLSVTDAFLYHAIHSFDLWLAEVFLDTGVTSVTTPVPQIPLDQAVYWYGLSLAGPFDPARGELTVFGLTTTFLVTGAPALTISYLPRPGAPSVGPEPAPTITFAASAGATAYEVDVVDAAGNLTWFGATSTSTSITLPMDLPAGGYTAQVFAFDSFTSADFIGGGAAVIRGTSATIRGRPPVRAVGAVLRAKDFRIAGLRGRRAEPAGLRRLARAFRTGSLPRRPSLDRMPLSNNDDRMSVSDAVAFTR